MSDVLILVPLVGLTALAKLTPACQAAIKQYPIAANMATKTDLKVVNGVVTLILTPLAAYNSLQAFKKEYFSGPAHAQWVSLQGNLVGRAGGVEFTLGEPGAFTEPLPCNFTFRNEAGQSHKQGLDLNKETFGSLKEAITAWSKIPQADQLLWTETYGPVHENGSLTDDTVLSDCMVYVAAEGGEKPYFTAPACAVGVQDTRPIKPDTYVMPQDFKICLYYSSWSVYRKHYLPAIDFTKITHLIYAFANVALDPLAAGQKPHKDLDGNPVTPGDVYMPDDVDIPSNFAALKGIRKQHTHLKTLLSIGGWTYSTNFSDTAFDPRQRKKFVDTAYELASRFNFDGIDIDWEVPVLGGEGGLRHRDPDDKTNFTLLLQELRAKMDQELLAALKGNAALASLATKFEAALNARAPGDAASLAALREEIAGHLNNDNSDDPKRVPVALTIALSPRPLYHQNYELEKLCETVDWFNLMAYDYFGSFPGTTITNFNAPLYPGSRDPTDLRLKHDFNIDASVRSILTYNVPPSQLVLGLSFYGRGFYKVQAVPGGDGLYQPCSDKQSDIIGGTWPGNLRAADGTYLPSGVYDYWDLFDNYLTSADNPNPTNGGYTQHFDWESQSAWLYNADAQILIAYDDPRTIWNKCAYLAAHELGGAMIWEASNDRYNQLLYVVNHALRDGGLKATGSLVPTTAPPGQAPNGTWNDKDVLAGKSERLTGMSFAVALDGVNGLKTHYETVESPWRGSPEGQLIYLIIPEGLHISRMDFHAGGARVTFKGLGISFDNRTYFSIGETDKTDDLTSIGVESSRLTGLSGVTDASGKLLQLACDFEHIPGRKARPFHRLELDHTKGSTKNVGVDPDPDLASQPVGIALANGFAYAAALNGSADQSQTNDPNNPTAPNMTVTAGSMDVEIHAIPAAKQVSQANNDQNIPSALTYKLGLHFIPEKARLKVGAQEGRQVTIDYHGPDLSYFGKIFESGSGGHDVLPYIVKATKTKGNIGLKVGNSLVGADFKAGTSGFTLDCNIPFKFHETLEFDSHHIKIGFGKKGIEINDKRIGFYFNLAPGFSIHIDLIDFAAFAGFAMYYVNIGKALWKVSFKAFSPFFKAAVAVGKVVVDIFKAIFG